MQTRLIIALVFLVLLLVSAGSLYLLFQARSDLQEAKGTIVELKATAEAYRASQEYVQEVAQAANIQRQEVTNALEANQDWAGTAVPDAVVAGLCKNSNCKTGKVQSSSN